eukprot:TRINITY_DN24582_c0_g1_i9.p1 TRINITY_DN24582_c0_g1~~TRINITY_DN24582_c0_g1_i9.p1  ORF type:complete len:164 (-),score=34.78 TRINITY_DN24582_c0_g1_i9:436-927(-)
MEDQDFIGSQRWIGSLEVGLVIEERYNIPCNIMSVHCGTMVCSMLPCLEAHLKTHGSPIMIGGATGYALTLVGVNVESQQVLVLDPHYAEEDDPTKILNTQWCGWFNCGSLFPKGKFFNFCLPQANSHDRVVGIRDRDNNLEVARVRSMAEEERWVGMCSTMN